MAESKEELKSLLMKMKQESEKVDLKLNIQKTKIMAPVSHHVESVTGRKARGLQMEEIAYKCQTFLSLLSGRRKQTSSWTPRSVQMVTAAMKLKDACSLKEKLRQTYKAN